MGAAGILREAEMISSSLPSQDPRWASSRGGQKMDIGALAVRFREDFSVFFLRFRKEVQLRDRQEK
jgi:hypothetical protein